VALRILIVEDDEVAGRATARALERVGYAVAGIVVSAEAAREAIAAERPDLVLSDIRIAGDCDGICLAEELYVCLRIPVIFASAHFDDATIARAIHAGAYGFLPKPYDQVALHTVIEIGWAKHQEVCRLGDLAELREAALHGGATALVVTDLARRVAYVNGAGVAALGTRLASLAGRDLGELLAGLDEWAAPDRLADELLPGVSISGRADDAMAVVAAPIDVTVVGVEARGTRWIVWNLVTRG